MAGKALSAASLGGVENFGVASLRFRGLFSRYKSAIKS